MERKVNINSITQNMGERLIAAQLSEYKGWEVEYVDYVGADLLALDPKTKNRYAISVKTRRHKKDGDSCSLFKDKDAKKLREFAASISRENNIAIPIVAYVVVKQDYSLCSFIINLDDLDAMREEQDNEIVKYKLLHKKGTLDAHEERDYQFTYGKEQLRSIKADERICYIIRHLEPENINMKNELYKEWDDKGLFLEKDYCDNQQGDFGENYVLWLSKYYNMYSFWVKTEGVDIISVDRSNRDKQYAVSVKTFTRKITKKTSTIRYTFEQKNIKKLRKFSDESRWNMVPVVSVNFLIEDKYRAPLKIININATLDYLEYLGNKEDSIIKSSAAGITFILDIAHIAEIKKDQNLLVKEIEFK